MNVPLDIAPMMVWAAVVLTLLNLGTALWHVLSGPSRRNAAAIKEAHSLQQSVDLRMQRLEDQLCSVPDREMLHRLEISMAKMEGHIDRMDERLKPVAAIAERMQELMLEQAKGK